MIIPKRIFALASYAKSASDKFRSVDVRRKDDSHVMAYATDGGAVIRAGWEEFSSELNDEPCSPCAGFNALVAAAEFEELGKIASAKLRTQEPTVLLEESVVNVGGQDVVQGHSHDKKRSFRAQLYAGRSFSSQIDEFFGQDRDGDRISFHCNAERLIQVLQVMCKTATPGPDKNVPYPVSLRFSKAVRDPKGEDQGKVYWGDFMSIHSKYDDVKGLLMPLGGNEGCIIKPLTVGDEVDTSVADELQAAKVKIAALEEKIYQLESSIQKPAGASRITHFIQTVSPIVVTTKTAGAVMENK